MRYSLAIFDLDGTLVDSFPWFLRHVNDIADRYGFRRIAPDDVESLRRTGSREILTRLDVPLWKLPLIARHMRQLKTKHAHEIALFPGAGEMLSALKESGVRLAMVSSDSEANVRQQLGDENAALFSDFNCGASLFGKAAKFRKVVKRAGVDPRSVIAIGDEVRDLEAARAAGIAFGAVTWGYAAAEALRAGSPEMVFERMKDIVRQIIEAG